jgi:hypothetical protein
MAARRAAAAARCARPLDAACSRDARAAVPLQPLPAAAHQEP